MSTSVRLTWLTLSLLLEAWSFLSAAPLTEAEREQAVTRLVRESDKHFHEGDYLAAIRCHRQIIELDPTYTEAYTNAAWLLWSMGRDGAAFALLERGRKRNPQEYEFSFDRGFYHYQAKRYGLAAAEFARAAACECPDYVYRMLAHALERKGDLTGARAVWQKLHRQDPKNALVTHHLDRLNKRLAEKKS